MSHDSDPLASAQHRAHEWLANVADALGTDERQYTDRVRRAWLHVLRDRLTVEGAAHSGAQLPEVRRGTMLSRGMLDHTLEQLPRDVRDLFAGMPHTPPASATAGRPDEARTAP